MIISVPSSIVFRCLWKYFLAMRFLLWPCISVSPWLGYVSCSWFVPSCAEPPAPLLSAHCSMWVPSMLSPFNPACPAPHPLLSQELSPVINSFKTDFQPPISAFWAYAITHQITSVDVAPWFTKVNILIMKLFGFDSFSYLQDHCVSWHYCAVRL